MEKSNRTIIFIPGFKGSTLISAEKGLVWPNFIKAQFDYSTSLANDLPTINITNPIHYESEDIVRSVPLLPGLYKYNIYAKFINTLQKNLPSDNELIVFHYDWRQDLLITIAKLKALIEQIAKDKKGKIDIICHSMGGLITNYILQTLEIDIVRQVFFVAVPFQGSLKILMDLIYGTKFGLNKTLLSAQAMSTFPSVYYLLPRYCGATVGQDLFDISTWTNLKLGNLPKSNDKEQLKFLKNQLDIVNHFYEKLESVENNAYENTKLIFITNQGYPTPTQILFEPKIRIIFGDGDGSVPKSSLAIPEYLQQFNHECFYINKSHALSFASNELIKIILESLNSKNK